MRRLLFLWFALWCVAAVIEPLFGGHHAVAQNQDHPRQGPSRSKIAGIHNCIQIAPGVFVGGVPDGGKSFAGLRQLGVTTVISVDGAKPNVSAAKKAGLQYVHLPIGYDAVPGDQILALAKAIRQSPGATYIHCHHGRHRAPAAAAAACITTGVISAEQGKELLKLAGTAPRYKGLFQSVETAAPVAPDRIDQYEVQFREIAEISKMADVMVRINHAVEVIRDSNTDSASPESLLEHPAHQATLLEEQFAELIRQRDVWPAHVDHDDTDFLDLLKESQTASAKMASLLDGSAKRISANGADLLAKPLDQLQKSCVKCHAQYRDYPRNSDATESAK